MMHPRASLRTAALVTLLTLSGSCGAPAEPTIGVILPESGRASRYGAMIRDGMDLALMEINAEGGINGQPMRLVVEDSGTDPDQGAEAARKLVNIHRVPAIIGAVNSSVTARVIDDVTHDAAVPLISPASSSPKLTGRSPFFFRVYPSDTLEGARMADLLSDELRLRRLVVFAVIDEYGAGYKSVMIDRYRRKRNREVLKVHNYAPDQTDFSAMMAETKQLEPDGVFLIGYVDVLATLARAVRDAGMTVQILCSGSITREFASLAGEAAEGVLYSRPDFRVIGNPEQVSRFVEAFRAEYGREPEDYAAYGYDTVKILAQIMRQGNLEARDIHMTLKSSTTYSGVTGNIVFGNEGDVVASPTTYIIHQGTAVPYKDYLEQQKSTAAESGDGAGS